jgi:hypothetical protein
MSDPMKKLSLLLLAGLVTVDAYAAEPAPLETDKNAKAVRQRLAPFFRPPDELVNDLGGYKSPLNYDDGTPI